MPSASSAILVKDRYANDQGFGKVIGSQGPDGIIRKGIDREGVIAIDNGALRIRPLIQSGWQRAGIVYGPFTRANGLTFATYILNGHNTSETEPSGDSLKGRLRNWLRGPYIYPLHQRLWRLLGSFHAQGVVRRWQRWLYAYTFGKRLPLLLDNLAVGWFPSEIPNNPVHEGNAFIVRAGGPVNGILNLRSADTAAPTILGLQNVPIYYITVLREQGAAYYAASLPAANGMSAYPNMRPLGIDAAQTDATVYAAIYQSTLGQVGWSVDTRIYASCVAQLSELAAWYGTAHAADTLRGQRVLDASPAEVGGVWHVPTGCIERTDLGATATAANSIAILTSPAPSGLIHALVAAPDVVDSRVGLVWRYQDQKHYWQFSCSQSSCELMLYEAGECSEIAGSHAWHLQPGATNSLQILDDGESFGLYLNGTLVFDQMFADGRLQTATGVGFHLCKAEPSPSMQQFESHPRSVPMPESLQFGQPWRELGKQVVISDGFCGPAGDLAGTQTVIGVRAWHKTLGPGHIDLTGTGAARVRASAQSPCPGRTAYTMAWDHPEFADLQVTITPPGTGRHQGENGRSGLIFWQDEQNYITINNWLDDGYGGASLSSFFFIAGYEELYDAVWTNVGQRIDWGKASTLRVAFDGLNFLALINDEPVLYRSLRDVYPKVARLQINRVGLVANWEFGTDTGSLFQDFLAKV